MVCAETPANAARHAAASFMRSSAVRYAAAPSAARTRETRFSRRPPAASVSANYGSRELRRCHGRASAVSPGASVEDSMSPFHARHTARCAVFVFCVNVCFKKSAQRSHACHQYTCRTPPRRSNRCSSHRPCLCFDAAGRAHNATYGASAAYHEATLTIR